LLSSRFICGYFWTALAERSGDSAFVRTEALVGSDYFPAGQSGVALRLPPQSILSVLKLHTILSICCAAASC
jgi:hypothetical protein